MTTKTLIIEGTLKFRIRETVPSSFKMIDYDDESLKQALGIDEDCPFIVGMDFEVKRG